MPIIKQSSIDDLRRKVPIEQVIGDYVALKKSGTILKGLSPFSHEKTPSFTVSPDKGLYYCFSTSQGGDMFSFIMNVESLNFIEAVEFIAKKFGIQLEYENAGDTVKMSLRRQLLEMHELTAAWFCQQFFADNPEASAVRKYWVEERQMTLDDARELRIGYAPSNSNELKKLLFAKKFSPEAMAHSSILSARDGARNIADFFPRFRGRLMIPICNIQGQVIAFTGRKTEFTPDLPSESGKYVNSRETEIFKKGDVVFNLHKAKTAMKEKNYCVLVEGQIDAIKMFSAGIKNAVATQGTALTDNHLSLVKRFCNRAVLMYDGDAAGLKANLKAISMCFKHELEPFIAPLDGGDDPDSFIRKFGAEAMREKVENKKRTAISFAVDALLGRESEKTAQTKGEVARAVFEMISRCKSTVIINEYLRELSAHLGASYASVAKDFETFAAENAQNSPKPDPYRNADAARSNAPSSDADDASGYKISTAPADALIIALLHPDIGAAMATTINPDWLDGKKLSAKILLKLFAIYKEGLDFDPSKVNEYFDTEKERNAVYKILANPKILIENPVKSANDCIKTIYKNYIDAEIKTVNEKLLDETVEESDKFKLLKRVADLKKLSTKAPRLIEEN